MQKISSRKVLKRFAKMKLDCLSRLNNVFTLKAKNVNDKVWQDTIDRVNEIYKIGV